jgi:hypothetical protein
MKNIITLVLSLVFVVVLTACKSDEYVPTTWKTLAITATLYDETMTELGELHTSGKLSDENAKKAISFGKKFTPLYLTAVNALETFIKNPTDDKLDVAKNAVQSAVDSLDLLIEFAKSFGVDKEKEVNSKVTSDNAKEIATSIIK